MTTPPLLVIRDLVKSYLAPSGEREVVLDIERFTLAEQDEVALVGASGSGKTTLLHLIAGITTADRGTISLSGSDITAMTEAARDRFRARHVGYVYQAFNLLQGYSALENVLLATMLAEEPRPHAARALLERLGLGPRLQHRPRQLSAGQQQRVALARALVNRPRLLLADEPTGNLDQGLAAAAVELIRSTCRELGAALLLVSHDASVLAQFPRVLQLADLNRARPSGARA
ncbi:MAG: ABC transporter ATP-binding protein [Planctomycetota bacterium]